MKNQSRVQLSTKKVAGIVAAAALAAALVPGVLYASQQSVSLMDDEEAAEESEVEEEESASSSLVSTAIFEKTETIYGELAADGQVESVYVVNSFDVDEAGTIVDFGNYTQVESLTDDLELERDGDTTVIEATEEGTLSYQGYISSTELPWNVSITYELDGEEVDASELSGATGELSIHLSTEQNEAVEETAFYECFLLQITFTLPSEAASDIVAEDATLSESSNSTAVTFTILPGYDADVELSAQVTNFYMDGIEISALSYSSNGEEIDVEELVGDMSALAAGIETLSEGLATLSTGIDELAVGVDMLYDDDESFTTGISQLGTAIGDLMEASSQIGDSITQIATVFDTGEEITLEEDLTELETMFEDLATGLDELSESATAAQEALDEAVDALGAAVDAIPEGTLDDSDLESLTMLVEESGSDEDVAALEELIETYEAAQAVKDTYAEVEQALEDANALLAEVASEDGSLAQSASTLSDIAASLSSVLDAIDMVEQVGQLVDGLSQLASEFSEFQEGVEELAEGIFSIESAYGLSTASASPVASSSDTLVLGLGETAVSLPETVTELFGSFFEAYGFEEFDPVSFVSSENENVVEVQFVLTTEAIEQPEGTEAADAEGEEEEEESIFDQIIDFFTE